MACSHNDNRFSFEEEIVDCLCQFSLYHNMLYCLGGVVFSHLIMLQIYGEILDNPKFYYDFLDCNPKNHYNNLDYNPKNYYNNLDCNPKNHYKNLDCNPKN